MRTVLTECLLLILGIFFLLRQRSVIRDTTLGPTWWWTLFSLFAVSSAEIWLSVRETIPVATHAAVRFAVAVSTFCPVISVLGAKRPQDGMWNFVVVSLWGMMILPTIETLALQRSSRLEVNDLRAWFLWLMIIMSVGNRIGTRGWLAGLVLGVAQMMLLAEFLPMIHRETTSVARTTALACLVASLGWLSRPLPNREQLAGLDRVWLDFRDLFGAWWGLRIVERINSAATINSWPVRLAWSGFQKDGSTFDETADRHTALKQSTENLLKRFVTDSWIEQRINRGTKGEAEVRASDDHEENTNEA